MGIDLFLYAAAAPRTHIVWPVNREGITSARFQLLITQAHHLSPRMWCRLSILPRNSTFLHMKWPILASKKEAPFSPKLYTVDNPFLWFLLLAPPTQALMMSPELHRLEVL
jgi:hypothetical protein